MCGDVSLDCGLRALSASPSAIAGLKAAIARHGA